MVGVLVGLLIAAAPATTSAKQLRHAIELMDRLDFDQANAALHKLLDGNPSPSEAAKAHLYLGVIAFNTLQIDLARSEFRMALAMNPAIELPFDSSPKARTVFAQVQRDINRESAEAPVPLAPRAEPVLAAAPLLMVSEPPPSPKMRHPIPATFWIGVGVAAAATGAGVALGVLSQSALSNAQSAPDLGSSLNYQNQVTTERIAANICFGGAIVVAAVATVLLLTASPVPVQ
jgi:hypothetical protein